MNKKILILSVGLSLVCVALAMLTFALFNNVKEFFAPYNVELQINENSELVIKQNKLFDQKQNGYVDFGDNGIYKNYKAVKLYESANYYFLTFSANVNNLDNDLFLAENIDAKKSGALYLIDKNSGNGVRLFVSAGRDNLIRVNLSDIRFIEKDIFVMPVYNLYCSDAKNLAIIKIINENGIFDIFETYLAYGEVENSDFHFKRFEITSKACVMEFYGENSKTEVYSLSPSFGYETEGIGDKKVIVSMQGGVNAKYIKSYDSEKYLQEGYFALSKGKIIYLSEDLSVKELITNLTVDSVISKSEFSEKYLNR